MPAKNKPACFLFLIVSLSVCGQKKFDNRAYWVLVLTKISNPVLTITKVLKEHAQDTILKYEKVVERAQRYAAVQERMISLEGTFPPIGRSFIPTVHIKGPKVILYVQLV